MKNPHEHVYMSELPGFTAEDSRMQPDRIDDSALIRLRSDRTRMLREIECDIAPDFFEAIRSKIAYEERTLSSLLDAQSHRDYAKEERRGSLKSEYFIRRPLPPLQF